MATEVQAMVLAVHETYLAAFPLECAHGTARNVGLHLHHGHPVPPVARAVYGRSCGVGFLAQQGLPLVPVLPVGAAWRRLHAQGLPLGMLLVSVYAPLQGHGQQASRAASLH